MDTVDPGEAAQGGPLMRAVLDTSLLARYLTNDDPGKAAQVRALLAAHTANDLIFPSVAVAELGFVLLRVYRWPVPDVAMAIRAVVTHPAIAVAEAPLWLDVADDLDAGHGLVDAYLMRLAPSTDSKTVMTFDAGIKPLPGITCREP